MTTTTPNVGFAGLGRMGRPMARQLIEAGFPVTVYNRTSSVTDAFTAETGCHRRRLATLAGRALLGGRHDAVRRAGAARPARR